MLPRRLFFRVEYYLRLKELNYTDTMDPKTLTTLLIVIVCILLFPVILGVAGGIFGLVGSILGGVFGLIGGLFGAIFGLFGAIFGAFFGVFGWLFDGHYHAPWSHDFFDGDFFTAALIVLVIVLVARSRRRTSANREN